jgi:type VI secretion system protein ImpA
MPREPFIAIDDLLLEIPGDNPAGEPVSFAVRAQLDEMRKEINPDDFDDNDPLRPTELKKADWKGIVRLTSEQLQTTSKDLLLAARLIEALTKMHGFAGFCDGVTLIRRMVDECWDRLYPEVEDGDLEIRAGQFNWLGDDGRGARFPFTLRTVPLFPFEGQAVSWYNWKTAQDKKGPFTAEQVEKAINNTPREVLHNLVESVDEALECTQSLLEVLNQRLGSAAPGWIDVRKALMEVATLTKGALQRQGGPISTEESPEAASELSDEQAGQDESEGSDAAPRGRRSTPTRADLYARLEETAQLLAAMEPHSPVPYLIRRAIDLGRLPFPEMMKKLLRPDYHQGLTEMDRELGIEPTEEAPQY